MGGYIDDLGDLGFPGVNLLVAVQVCQFQVGVAVFAAQCPWLFVMLVQLFGIEEAVSALTTDVPLVPG